MRPRESVARGPLVETSDARTSCHLSEKADDSGPTTDTTRNLYRPLALDIHCVDLSCYTTCRPTSFIPLCSPLSFPQTSLHLSTTSHNVSTQHGLLQVSFKNTSSTHQRLTSEPATRHCTELHSERKIHRPRWYSNMSVLITFSYVLLSRGFPPDPGCLGAGAPKKLSNK